MNKMQHLFDISCPWYFVVGVSDKTSLCAEFCRENNYSHFVNPTSSELNPNLPRSCIIQGSTDLFYEIEQLKPDLSVIEMGQDCLSKSEAKIISEYRKIGRHFKIPKPNYDHLRRQLYPNLIFFYGPSEQQNEAAASTLAGLIDYKYTVLPQDVNGLISGTQKCQNYIVNGFFTNPQDLHILEKYFNFRLIHFKYSRMELPNQGKFFDDEYNLIPHLRDKPYYIPVKGSCTPIKIMDDVGIALCPRLRYVDMITESDREYVQQYLEETGGVQLIIEEIQEINWRKKIPVAESFDAKLKRLTTIFYKDLNCKEIMISSFPNSMNELIALENINRKFDCFIDLRSPEDYQPSMEYTNQIYFLETQKIVIPSKKLSLKSQLEPRIEYWIVQGVAGAGKTTVAKHIAQEFGLKFLEFEQYIVSLKQKLANPDEGEEMPLNKILLHFSSLIRESKDQVYIFDSVPYEGKQLEEWLRIVGVPTVISLEVSQGQQIKRTRKKAESDLNAQINEQQSSKAKQSAQKGIKWIEKVEEVCPEARIFQVDYNMPQILAESSFNSIMRPRIYLVQRNNTLVYQNVALKHDMGFINLRINKLADCKALVKNSKRRDIILSGYQKVEEKFVSEDLYWIEKNLGEVRYLGIWEPESKEAEEEELVIEKEVVPQNPQAAEGEDQDEEKPTEDPPAEPPVEEGENANQKKFDIYDFKWTKPTSHKNLSQWFFKLKANIKQVRNSPIDCYDSFSQILEQINRNSDIYFYEIITQ